MILPQLTGRGLFVFSDPGGAKPILSYAKINSKLEEVFMISDRVYPFFANFDISVISYQKEESEQEMIQRYNPDFVFTGTSYTSQIEIKFLRAAKKMGIPTYSFIDHYTSYRERFQLDGHFVYPDFICVIDDKAKQIATEKRLGAPLIISGNYYHDYLKGWKPDISKEAFFRSINIPLSEKKICLYGPDPLSNLVKEKETSFDEIEATIELSKIAYQLTETHQFILNPHPNQNIKKIANICERDIILIRDPVDVNTLIYYSDVVIGFFSNFLIEATILKKPVIRFFLNKEFKDPLALLNIGKVAYPETIIGELQLI